jgi:hypothetical protein
MYEDLIDRTGHVINATDGLRLHARGDLDSATMGMLDNGTKFRIKGVQGKFYYIVVLKGGHAGKVGYVWKDKGRLDGKYYVELEPLINPEFPIPPSPIAKEGWKTWTVAAVIIVGMIGLVYSCGVR